MRVRFWGTRGSIPVGLTVADVRDKLARALLAASGRHFDSYGDALGFVQKSLPGSLPADCRASRGMLKGWLPRGICRNGRASGALGAWRPVPP